MSAEPAISPGLTDAEAALVSSCLAPVGQRPATALQVAERLDELAATTRA
jgi:hypothetical protein